MFAQDSSAPPTIGIEEAYLAKDNGDGKAGEQVTEFRTTDVPIHCIILLETPAVTTVKMNFVAVNVPGVKADTKVVTTSYTTKAGQNRVNFTGRPDGKWVPGRYRVDLYVDDLIARTIEFSIRGNGAEAKSSKLTTGTKLKDQKPQ